ncbi:MAG: LptA/OstA family protein, partial [Planktothrix sp.]
MLIAKLLTSISLSLGFTLLLPIALVSSLITESVVSAGASYAQVPPAKNAVGRAMTVRSDIQEADAQTGIVTARGNVQINYPARSIQATAAQAQYFSRERRIILSGNVFVLQEGNTIRGETVTYLIDEGRFIALPQGGGQVESMYLVPDESASPK